MPTIIKIVEDAIQEDDRHNGRFLRFFDPDAEDGRGHFVTTEDPGRAMVFSNKAAAMACWNTPSTIRPFRPDGKPNKPLTAFTVELVETNLPANLRPS